MVIILSNIKIFHLFSKYYLKHEIDYSREKVLERKITLTVICSCKLMSHENSHKIYIMYLVKNSHPSLKVKQHHAVTFVEIKQRTFNFENDEFSANMALTSTKGRLKI